MARGLAIKIDSGLLQWAREASGRSIEEVSKKTKIGLQNLNKWESVSSEIAISDIKRLAKIYKRQLSFFFLPSAPKEKPIPPDFRTLDSVKISELSQKVRLAIRRAQANRKTINDFFPEEYRLRIKKSISLDQNPTDTGVEFRKLFNLTVEQQIKQKDEKESLAYWIGAIEEKGIPIFQMDLDKGFRGFCLRENELLPVIVINAKDVRSAKTFTLIHELCHLFIKQSEIDYLVNQKGEDKAHKIIETFANEFAGSFLVPNEYLQAEELYQKYKEDKDDTYVSKLAKKYNVSQSVILRRFCVLGVITNNEYEIKEKQLRDEYEKIKQLQEDKFKKNPNSFVPKNVPKETIQKIGFSLGEKAFNAVSEGRMTTFDLVQFLDIKTRHLESIQGLIEKKYYSVI